ncbi:uncharacterized protein LOC110822507 isoform X2 [Carica papaya]|uniref:uncharacterized protein LOC110822507 isoform X2 n=1 Tax=Carica papaya TaxID=3649 RepID=UPI000B8C79C6|nr:uncharacterized protein LOC110822507 isoform X2 [Carica papaya]
MATDDSTFLKIRDAATAIDEKVNLVGVIIEFGFPRKPTALMKTFNQEPYAIFRFCHREQDKDLIAGLRDWFVGLKFEEVRKYKERLSLKGSRIPGAYILNLQKQSNFLHSHSPF